MLTCDVDGGSPGLGAMTGGVRVRDRGGLDGARNEPRFLSASPLPALERVRL